MKALIEIYWNHGENSNCKVESFRFKWWKLDENGKWHRNGTIHRKWLCSNPAHPIPRAPPTQCGSPRQSSPPAIGHVNMFETSQLAQDGHSKSIKIDQNPKDSTLPSNVRMIWAMAILWIVWDLSLFRDLHKVLGGLPWPTVAYRGLAWPSVAYRGLPWPTFFMSRLTTASVSAPISCIRESHLDWRWTGF